LNIFESTIKIDENMIKSWEKVLSTNFLNEYDLRIVDYKFNDYYLELMKNLHEIMRSNENLYEFMLQSENYLA
jgi:hypothetical protein